jgi:hypothetical protein
MSACHFRLLCCCLYLYPVTNPPPTWLQSALVDKVNSSITDAPVFHAERRSFLRNALHQLLALVTEQPGLINPQMLVICRGLMMAKDEVQWLLRHRHSPTPKAKAKLDPRVFQDPYAAPLLSCLVCGLMLSVPYSELAELLSHAMELKRKSGCTWC